MIFGDRNLQDGDKGADVAELQLRLAGFLGTVWDGDFGPNTEKQVKAFQQDYMKSKNPQAIVSGIVDKATFEGLDEFAREFPINFKSPLTCSTCPNGGGGNCSGNGMGQDRFKGIYRRQKDKKLERHHQHEYPGIHKAIFHTYRAFQFYAKAANLPNVHITSGYRCHVNNIIKGRSSSNHMGKALDFTFASMISENELKRLCNQSRDLLKEKSNCQIRWGKKNRKALEPGTQIRPGEFTAPVWIHLDVREYDQEKYLAERFFVKTAAQLDGKNLD